MSLKTVLLASAALAFLVGGTGCSNKESAERTSLLSQNDDLKRQLDAERAARVASEARANAATDKATTVEQVTPPSMDGGPLDLSSGPVGRGPAPRPPAGRGGRGPTAPVTSGNITSSTNDRGEAVLEVPGDVLFDSGKATVKASAHKTLDTIAATLKSKYPGDEIRIEGYTDPNPVKNSGWDDNYDLGAARANKVRIYLQGKGVKNLISIASYGPTKLKSTKNMAINRRVDIVVVKNAK